SVEATFDGHALASTFSTDPDGDGPLSPLPAHWWQGDNATQVISVELERQELKPDGTWTDAVAVKHMPGRFEFTQQELTQAQANAEEMKNLLSDAGFHADEIRHPKAYQVIFGEDWVPPSEAGALTEGLAAAGGADQVRILLAKR